ncbi:MULTISPECIES: hypothetical protein [unclassified Sphingobium]|uniref:hypothetical protein n=1 Tax=unclassified Sphingobium TaxID=2611147 RepID=UPI00119DB16F|nr:MULTISPECIES: hypothetical protein [unclassified Sphingobium]MBG6116720.1 hypothetical protein [Sphingobium sp. JAI105]
MTIQIGTLGNPLSAFRTSDNGVVVWCDHCRNWHAHGRGSPAFGIEDGHRSAHCRDKSSPDFGNGYHFSVRGALTLQAMAERGEFLPVALIPGNVS